MSSGAPVIRFCAVSRCARATGSPSHAIPDRRPLTRTCTLVTVLLLAAGAIACDRNTTGTGVHRHEVVGARIYGSANDGEPTTPATDDGRRNRAAVRVAAAKIELAQR